VSILQRKVNPVLVSYCFFFIGLNMFDAFATLHHLEHGAYELNPFMGAMLKVSPLAFFIVKYLLCIPAIIGIVIAPYRTAKIVIGIVVPLYVVIGVYQIVMFFV
jgi:Domain of unknown function (DUF5658)